MGNTRYGMIFKQYFPLIFAFAFTLYYWIVVKSPLLAMHMPSIFWLFALTSAVSFPFILLGYGNPVILLAGAVLIALLCGAVQYFYWRKLAENRKWHYALMIVVTWLLTGFLLAVSFLLVVVSTYG